MGEKICDVDAFIMEHDVMINDKTIKNLLINQSANRTNPDENKFVECNVEFSKKENSIFDGLLKNIRPFNYTDERDEDKELEFYGPLYVLSENSIYVGQVKMYQLGPDKRSMEGCREGRGTQFFQDGSYYEGYFVSDTANRKGRLIFCDGDMYLGDLVDNSMNGNGIYYKKDGSKYTGTFINDLPEGEGKEEWEDGSIYKGGYISGCKSGHGEFKFSNGTKYCGNFENDLFSGRGTLHKPDNTSYEGNWVLGTLQSPAKINFPNGNVFDGSIDNLIQHGSGVLHDHGVQFIGVWDFGKLQGDVI